MVASGTGSGKRAEPDQAAPRPARLLAEAAVPAALACFFAYEGRIVFATAIAAMGAATMLAGFLSAPLYIRIDRLRRRLGGGLAAVVTWILLATLFVVVFVPGRLLLRLRRLDPMCRRIPTTDPTYWIEHRRRPDDDLTRQF